MDPYSSPYVTHYNRFHFLFYSSFPANQRPVLFRLMKGKPQGGIGVVQEGSKS